MILGVRAPTNEWEDVLFLLLTCLQRLLLSSLYIIFSLGRQRWSTIWHGNSIKYAIDGSINLLDDDIQCVIVICI